MDESYYGTSPVKGEKLSHLRQKLYQKAKQEPKFRFYTLYHHLFREDVLQEAWRRVKANKGASGVDGVRIADIEKQGIDEFLKEISESLGERRYKPDPVLRKYIPKANGQLRPLGIPTVRDRVVQTSLLLILEPIFEADFQECSYGFRPDRSAHQAIKEVEKNLRSGFCEVYDLDLSSYFDTIPHDKLLKCLRMRIVDRSVLKLIRLFLKTSIKEESTGKKGKPKWSKPRKGTPQGGVLSPLLANVYLHWFDKVFCRSDGPIKWANARLVRYADDLVIMARYIGDSLKAFIQHKIENWLDLQINHEKTQIVNLREPKSSLDFLGYTFRYDKDLKGASYRYLNLTPSKKALKREREKIRQMTSSRMCFKPVANMIQEINAHLRGWANYFELGYPRKAFRHINFHVRRRLTIHLRRRSQRPCRPPKGVSYYQHLKRLGLVYL